MSLFNNKNISLLDLDEEELSYAGRFVDGDSWDEILEYIEEVPPWLAGRSADWEEVPLISFDFGDAPMYGRLFIIWDNAHHEGIMCDAWSAGVIRVDAIEQLDLETVAPIAVEYIKNTWGFWANGSGIYIGREDLLPKQTMLECLTNNNSVDWAECPNADSPQAWVDKYYS